ncbi:MAG: glutamate 5-kinase [SAR86 cluster bacterium]|uniref:Glutamate 5-kinase n=1 Tax=SAR86 cluster bacterium TaxID=2030880 RepID=A0A2A5CFD7_9GAMM|nr:glutamate 5-kinase [Gammaproteobacteria bacterium AH-315-E17]PCJ42604.1 MAG: glutamate 5-kinase [SAR86 cluster bacterium]
MSNRELLKSAKTWVIKVGSSLVTDNGKGLNREAIASWVEQIIALQKKGIAVVLVSSGAVAEGVARLGLSGRPTAIYEQQAAAAVGQMGLIEAYERCFSAFNKHTAQILLTHEDLSDRTRYLNARSTLNSLLKMGVIPIINENDTVATEEICFGDNDTLGGLVANLINAQALVIMTDQNGFYDADPRSNPQAQLIKEAKSNDKALLQYAGDSGALGKGGMLTKLKAARLAARSGAVTAIVNGNQAGVLLGLYDGDDIGSLLLPDAQPIAARKQWLASHLKTCGTLVLDDGAVNVLKKSGRSLLPVGIKSVEGKFLRGEMVDCVDSNGKTVARGLVNYDASEAREIISKSSDQIMSILGYDGDHEMIHRDNLVLL